MSDLGYNRRGLIIAGAYHVSCERLLGVNHYSCLTIWYSFQHPLEPLPGYTPSRSMRPKKVGPKFESNLKYHWIAFRSTIMSPYRQVLQKIRQFSSRKWTDKANFVSHNRSYFFFLESQIHLLRSNFWRGGPRPWNSLHFVFFY